MDEDALFELAEEHDLVVRMTCSIGSFVIQGDSIATAAASGIEDDVARELRKVFHLGSERTLYQDVVWGIIAPPDRLGPLVAEARELLESVRRSVDSRADLERLEQVGAEALDSLLTAAPDRAGLEGRRG